MRLTSLNIRHQIMFTSCTHTTVCRMRLSLINKISFGCVSESCVFSAIPERDESSSFIIMWLSRRHQANTCDCEFWERSSMENSSRECHAWIYTRERVKELEGYFEFSIQTREPFEEKRIFRLMMTSVIRTVGKLWLKTNKYAGFYISLLL